MIETGYRYVHTLALALFCLIVFKEDITVGKPIPSTGRRQEDYDEYVIDDSLEVCTFASRD